MDKRVTKVYKIKNFLDKNNKHQWKEVSLSLKTGFDALYGMSDTQTLILDLEDLEYLLTKYKVSELELK